MSIIEQLEAVLVCCKAVGQPDRDRRRACHCCPLCESLIRDEIQPAIESILEQIKQLPG